MPLVPTYLYTPDLSQVEMRIAAHLSGDPTMCRLLSTGADLHDNSTRAIYRTTEEELKSLHGPEQGEKLWKNMRYLAKTIGFGVLYGLQAQGLILRTPTLNLTIQDAKRFIDLFYGTYPGLRAWQRQVVADARRLGYTTTILGRRRYFPDLTSKDAARRSEAERAAMNAPIQGSAADYFKLCVLAVEKKLQEHNLYTRIIMQVHDEIIMEGPEFELEILATEVIPVMTSVYPLRVPVKVDIEYGKNWGKLQKYKAHAA